MFVCGTMLLWYGIVLMASYGRLSLRLSYCFGLVFWAWVCFCMPKITFPGVCVDAGGGG